MKKFFIIFTLSILIGISLAVGVGNGFAQSADCIIPSSGPWPPCATGTISEPSVIDCVIPPTGPWPSCATSRSQQPTTTSQPTVEPVDKVITPQPFGTDISLGFGVDGACHVMEPIQKWSVADINEKPAMTLAATYMAYEIGQSFTWRLYDPFGVEILSQTETLNGNDNCFTRDIALPNLYTFGFYQLSITVDDTNIFGRMFKFVE